MVRRLYPASSWDIRMNGGEVVVRKQFSRKQLLHFTAPAITVNERVRLLLQIRRKVRNHGDGLADLLRNPVQQDFPSVGSDVVKGFSQNGPSADDALRGAEFEGATGIPDLHRKKSLIPVQIVELSAVLAP